MSSTDIKTEVEAFLTAHWDSEARRPRGRETLLKRDSLC